MQELAQEQTTNVRKRAAIHVTACGKSHVPQR